MAGRRSASSILWYGPRGFDLPFSRSMRLERETPSVSATAFIANRPSATRSAAISVFLSPLWKGLRGGFRPPSSCDRACTPTPGRDPLVSSLPNSRQPARQNPRLQHLPRSRACATDKANWARRHDGERSKILSRRVRNSAQ